MSYKTIGERLAKLLEKAQQLRARAQSAGLPKCTECGKPFRKRVAPWDTVVLTVVS